MRNFKRGRLLRAPIALLLCFGLMAGSGALSAATAPAGSLDHFQKENDFSTATFSDVQASNWFYDNVKTVYEYGLMVGDSATTFRPNGNVTIAETITLAARLHSIFYTGKNDFKASKPWYRAYVDYAMANGILSAEYENYGRPATRAEYAVILSSAFPDEALAKVNQVPNNTIPDVKMSDTYGEAVYRLYRAGVLIGNDDKGTFSPDSNIQRSEVAAIISRMADADKRIVKNTGGSSKPVPPAEVAGPSKPTPPIETAEPSAEVKPAIYNPSFVVETVNAKAGDRDVAVTVSLKNNPGIASVGMMVSYDSALTLKSIVYNDELGGQYMLPPAMNNPVKLIWVSLAEVTEDCALATLYFDVSEDAAPGNYQIAAVYDEDDVYDAEMNNVSFEVINGTIHVVE